MSLLSVRDLMTEFGSPSGVVRAVDGISFDVNPGEIFGIVGESGCGKSATCRSILRLFGGAAARVSGGQILLEGVGDLVPMKERALSKIRGSDVAFIFQDPLTALNPTMRVGKQISEVIRRHRNVSKKAAREAALQLLRDVHVTSPERRLDAYPHELSGGLRQRVVIAMALALRPRLIIADEPTTALDVTVQDQILRLLKERRDSLGASIILVTHDLGVVSQICDRMAVMYAGRMVETGTVRDVLDKPSHPYTKALLAALPGQAARDQELVPIQGAPPGLVNPPDGCRFVPRCFRAQPRCAIGRPPALELRGGSSFGHLDACILNEVANVSA
ncbi:MULTISPECIES: ABC transporter ATP-binding protein [Brucella]|uniref:Oligopeptide transport ATP-binding protein OppD (TC 3.A.1.5.1) n=1 Tax=Ochrobactrum soli TaxID=2448455 RepID=A0A2P9HBT9_9HYPH|nr:MULTISPECIES: ABC transporter ATP-binding protein [Brucella]MCI1002209.1 ABC transporter ATP-binding protein [Ochrobactrum sp. C6C9]RRD25278.1 ABC transporter ATP-binding protein [Brucellaceae bacterium VT-16-1752]WHT44553.1 ABC transporter ATP-binding protein [Ochrobactrum sp. SSR]MDX4072093.1 ABC transporter ATP-binding protein [Brucella sp. NBRC 113783]WHS29959.1 ABC transporter ATP-binding protein [Brucella sp. NM4]